MRLEALTASLERLDWKYELLRDDRGAAIVALERGGRIIGVYPDAEQENAVWTNPILLDYDKAKTMFNEGNECHTGGERTWLSPELEYFVENLASETSYTVQQSIDPGTYQLDKPNDMIAQCSWRQEGTAQLFGRGQAIPFTLSKSCRFIEDPLRISGFSESSSYHYVGYESEVCLATEGFGQADPGGQAVPLNSWTILQVPAGGYAYVSTYGIAQPTDFFAPTGPSHLSVTNGAIRFNIDAKESHKISLKSVQTTGRYGYLRRCANGQYDLIVRQISVMPSSSYLDFPWGKPDDRGHCVQLYNDDGQIGQFGELEHHAPAVQWNEKSGQYKSRDISQLWCYNGDYDTIVRVSRLLMGIEI